MTTEKKSLNPSAIPAPFFRDLVRPSSPNNWLIGPASFPGGPDEAAPVFRFPAERLEKVVQDVISQTKNISDIRVENLFLCFVVETEVLRFKDDVCIQIISMGEKSSTIAAYSASRIGYWDLGANKKRLRRLIQRLQSADI